MNNKKEFLTEENYERGKKKIKTIAFVILVIGILIGGSLIITGLMKQGKINSKYSEKNKTTLSQELETEKQNLISKKSEIEAKIEPVETQIKKLQRESFAAFDDAYYERQDKIEELEKSIATETSTLNVINDVLEDANFACAFEGKTNAYTSKYCSLNNQLNDVSSDFNKEFDSFDSIPYYMIGGFIIIASGMVAFSIFMFAKRREVMAFTAQQTMPVAQEAIEKMAPTIGKAAGIIEKEKIEQMAPTVASAAGAIGKEFAKGIKEGISEANKENDN